MSGAIDTLNPGKPKRVLVLASNPTVSQQTGWPVGFWWSELTHPYWEFTERGYEVEVASPEGLSLGFVNSPEHMKLIELCPAASRRTRSATAF